MRNDESTPSVPDLEHYAKADERQLDCPPWSALTSDNRQFAQGSPLALRYHPDVAPFGALAEQSDSCFRALIPLIPTDGRVALQTFDPIKAPAPLVIDRQAPLFQMVLSKPLDKIPQSGLTFLELGRADVPEMMELAERTRPGPFAARTIELGRYIGIRSGGTLIAMVGERMRFGRFVEVSAVCVDPKFRGKGLAEFLIMRLSRDLQSADLLPFLHVFESNDSAVSLYEKLGFTKRRSFYMTSIRLSA
jgi:ribosomal protein S18 acetylase RimI-like enzyme